MQQTNNLTKSLSSKNNNNFLSLLKSSNPNELVQKLISSNPQLNSVMQLMQTSGKTPKDFFYTYAQMKGVNPDEFLNSLMKEE